MVTPDLVRRGFRQASLAVRLALVLSGGGGIVTLVVFAFIQMSELARHHAAKWAALWAVGLVVALVAGGAAGISAGRRLYKALVGDHRFLCFGCGEKAAFAKPGHSYDGVDGRAVAWHFECERCGEIDRGDPSL